MKFLRKPATVLLIFLVLFGCFTFLQFGFIPNVNALAPSTVANVGLPTYMSQQHHNFYDGTYYWCYYQNGTTGDTWGQILAEYSSDGVTWSNTPVNVLNYTPTSSEYHFSLKYYLNATSGVKYVYMAYQKNTTVSGNYLDATVDLPYFRRDSISGTTLTLGTEYAVETMSTTYYRHACPEVELSTTGMVFVSYSRVLVYGLKYAYLVISRNANPSGSGSWTVATWNLFSFASSTEKIVSSMTRLANSTGLVACVFTGSDNNVYTYCVTWDGAYFLSKETVRSLVSTMQFFDTSYYGQNVLFGFVTASYQPKFMFRNETAWSVEEGFPNRYCLAITMTVNASNGDVWFIYEGNETNHVYMLKRSWGGSYSSEVDLFSDSEISEPSITAMIDPNGQYLAFQYCRGIPVASVKFYVYDTAITAYLMSGYGSVVSSFTVTSARALAFWRQKGLTASFVASGLDGMVFSRFGIAPLSLAFNSLKAVSAATAGSIVASFSSASSQLDSLLRFGSASLSTALSGARSLLESVGGVVTGTFDVGTLRSWTMLKYALTPLTMTVQGAASGLYGAIFTLYSSIPLAFSYTSSQMMSVIRQGNVAEVLAVNTVHTLAFLKGGLAALSASVSNILSFTQSVGGSVLEAFTVSSSRLVTMFGIGSVSETFTAGASRYLSVFRYGLAALTASTSSLAEGLFRSLNLYGLVPEAFTTEARNIMGVLTLGGVTQTLGALGLKAATVLKASELAVAFAITKLTSGLPILLTFFGNILASFNLGSIGSTFMLPYGAGVGDLAMSFFSVAIVMPLILALYIVRRRKRLEAPNQF